MDQGDRRGHLAHLGPSYGMDFDRHDYAGASGPQSAANPYLAPLPMGNGSGSGMNDISALAAAASDQLYELERHEAFRRAEYELRHRQIAAGASGRSKSNGGSPGAGASTPGNYGFAADRERFAQGAPAPGGGQIVFPLSAPQPATANHPAVPAGTLADPTYLVPPTCCHDECHKSYRKRLKVARQTAACPNCLSPAHGLSSGHSAHGAGGAGHGNGGDHGHSSSSTPKDRSNIGSSEDLTKLGGGGSGSGSAPGGNSYHLHHASLQQQLARLQQQHTLSQQKSRSGQSQPQPHKSSTGLHHHINPYPVNMHHHRSSHASLAPSAEVSRAASPSSDDDSDDEMPNLQRGHPEYSHTSPVLAGMRGMTLFPIRNVATAPVSIAASPVGSRAPSPVEGHSASSGKHGHGSHTARDAKSRSHPYSHHHSAASHHHHHHSHGSVPNSPMVSATKSRMSPPRLPEPHSGHKSVEEILNSGSIPPPNRSDRTLPPPNSGYSSVASLSYSLTAGSAHGSPVGSRSSSPVHSTHSSNSHLANSVRQAFGMTPMFRGSEPPSTNNPSPKSVLGGLSPPPKLAPLGVGNPDIKPSLPSFSRGPSPVHLMELDGAA